MSTSTAFHPGELQVQRLAGTRGVADELSAGLHDQLPSGGGLNPLLHKLRFLAVAFVAPGTPTTAQPSLWVSLIFGREFVHSSSSTHLTVSLAGLPPTDILRETLRTAADPIPVAAVAVHQPSRRRYRANGTARPSRDATLTVSVLEAFPNCPKYIHSRDVTAATTDLPPTAADAAYTTSDTLSPPDRTLIARADALWLGTHYSATGADANHRGGRPGFVRVASDTEIFWPEYRGNGMFQSSGNLALDDRAGVSFVDFDTGHTLQLSGRARVVWDVDPALGVERAAMRVVRFQVERVRRSAGAATNYRWTRAEVSPYSPIVGRAGKGAGEKEGGFPMAVTLVKVWQETREVKTFRWLAGERVQFQPGQYGTFDMSEAVGTVGRGREDAEAVVRTWTLSEIANSSAGDVTLEISVKRKAGGAVSTWLHDCAKVGTRATLLGVGGEMTPFGGAEGVGRDGKEREQAKLLLVSGGIGMTPNMAILRGVGARGWEADVVVVHQERRAGDMPFAKEIGRRARVSRGRIRAVEVVSGEARGDAKVGAVDGVDRVAGRVDERLLRRMVADVAERTVFLCGPVGFMEMVKGLLARLGVEASRVVTEEFSF